MYCKCGHKTKVMNSRNIGDEVIRQRKCTACGAIIHTCEFEDDTGYAKRKLSEWMNQAEKERYSKKALRGLDIHYAERQPHTNQ